MIFKYARSNINWEATLWRSEEVLLDIRVLFVQVTLVFDGWKTRSSGWALECTRLGASLNEWLRYND